MPWGLTPNRIATDRNSSGLLAGTNLGTAHWGVAETDFVLVLLADAAALIRYSGC